MICWILKRIWFKTYSGSISQGLFFSRVAGCFGVGQRYAGNRARKVSVTQRRFRKVVAKDFTDESDSSLWNLTSLLVVRRSSLDFCSILLVKSWKNPLKGLCVMRLSYVENFGKCQPLFITERVDLFSFMAMDSSHSKQINTAISRVQKQNRNRNHQYTQTFNLCIRSRVAQVSHTAAKVAFHNIRAFTCWIICCT